MTNVVDSDIAEIGERLGEVADAFAGKRMVLAGGGGFLLLCAKPGLREECAVRVGELGAASWPFEFDFDGVSASEEPAWSEEELEGYRRLIAGDSSQG